MDKQFILRTLSNNVTQIKKKYCTTFTVKIQAFKLELSCIHRCNKKYNKLAIWITIDVCFVNKHHQNPKTSHQLFRIETKLCIPSLVKNR